jgi:hypothetical protein
MIDYYRRKTDEGDTTWAVPEEIRRTSKPEDLEDYFSGAYRVGCSVDEEGNKLRWRRTADPFSCLARRPARFPLRH